MNLDLIKYQTAKWYDEETKKKVVTVMASDFKGMIQALGEAKKLINDIDSNNTIDMDDYRKWTQKYFGEE